MILDLPKNTEAESNVLGAIIVAENNHQQVHDGLEVLKESHFTSAENIEVFNAIHSLYQSNQPIELVPVSNLISKSTKSYLVEIAKNASPAATLYWYVEKLVESAKERSLIERLNMATNTLQGEGSHTDKMERALSYLSNIDDESIDDSSYIEDELEAYLEEIDRRFNSGGEIIGLATGFTGIDEKIQGLRAGDLFIIAGRPAMGKTAIAINIAENVANNGGHVKVFSMEMPRTQLIERITASQGEINLGSLRSGKFTQEDWPKVRKSMVKARSMRINFDDRGGLNIHQVKAAARKTHRRSKLDLIVLDYIQLMAGTKGHGNRVGEITEITRELKALAKELEVPIIALSQLSRKVEERNDKRPMMSDLRESGSIEQDADQIMMMYRDEYYDEDSPFKGLAEGILVKLRAGQTGTVKLESQLMYSKFKNLSIGWPDVAKPIAKNNRSFARGA